MAHLADEGAGITAGLLELSDVLTCTVTLVLELIIEADKLTSASVKLQDSLECDCVLLVLGVSFDNLWMFTDEA
jgi:hypothetical protein